MSERYSRLFSMPKNLYCAGAPVVIAAGALQKHNQTGKVLAQLKIRNIQDKIIKAATVKIAPFDTAGRPLDSAVNYQYLDLSVKREADFGQKTPVMLPDAGTRSFSVAVAEVVFSDSSVWTASDGAWEALSAPVSLEKAFSDNELVKQYRIKYGADCKCIFNKEKDLWRCACGAINHDGENKCYRCGREAAALAALDLDELKADRDKRLAAERQRAAEEQKKAAEERAAAEQAAAERARKIKKTIMIAAPIIAVAVIAAVLISINSAKKNAAYDAAVALVEAGEYDEAIDAFTELGDYKDSAERIKEIPYREMITISFADTYKQLAASTDDSEYIQELKEICQHYSLYCGEFVGDDDGYEMKLTSDFYWYNGEVCWKAQMAEGCEIVLGFGNDFHYFFAEQQNYIVNSSMEVTDEWRWSSEDKNSSMEVTDEWWWPSEDKFTVTATFKDGKIYISVSDDYGELYNFYYTKAD
ncbi:MAG: hypothetical protein NC319_04805 [Butyricicoccus sp.]|nr:hypothetical protein [Butyricicoccus sp.]MCM1236215.1 hypothetical protein [Ruminococcus flavefaciens]